MNLNLETCRKPEQERNEEYNRGSVELAESRNMFTWRTVPATKSCPDTDKRLYPTEQKSKNSQLTLFAH